MATAALTAVGSLTVGGASALLSQGTVLTAAGVLNKGALHAALSASASVAAAGTFNKGALKAALSASATVTADGTVTSPEFLMGGFDASADFIGGVSNGVQRASLSGFFANTEVLSSAASTLGIANSFTVMTTQYHNVAGIQTIFEAKADSGNANRILVEDVSGTHFRVTLYNSAGTLFKQYRYQHDNFNQHWEQFTFTWNGTNLKMFIRGGEVTPTFKDTDNAGTMTDTARRVYVGGLNNDTQLWRGYIQSVALWSDVLTVREVLSVYNAGMVGAMNLQGSFEQYASSGDLEHWWRLGHDVSLLKIGQDYEGSLDLTVHQLGAAALTCTATVTADGTVTP